MAVRLLNEDDEITVTDAEIAEDGDKDTTYTLRKITPETQRKIRRANTRAGNHRRAESVNWDGVQDDQIDHALKSWTGIVDGGKPVPCERHYKLRLDPIRKAALLDKAGLSDLVDAEEARDRSFRPTA